VFLGEHDRRVHPERVTVDLVDDVARTLVLVGPPVTVLEVEDAERLIGHAFPTLLREVYLRVGVGGVPDVPHHLVRPSEVATHYRDCRSTDRNGWEWPEFLLPIASWGCGISACVMAATSEVWWFDPNLDWPDSPEFRAPPWATGMDLADWMRGFIDGAEFTNHWELGPNS
jgi:hypothetical protein